MYDVQSIVTYNIIYLTHKVDTICISPYAKISNIKFSLGYRLQYFIQSFVERKIIQILNTKTI